MNYRIVFLFLLAVSITSTVLLFSMDLYIQIYDPDWYGILNLNQKTDDEKKRIFLIGGSTVYSINALYLNEKLSENEINFEVYNLADMSDTPTRRLNSIENIIDNKPEIVFYGLGYTDFEKFEVKEFDPLSTFINNPNELFRSSLEHLLDEHLEEHFPLSPKDKSLTSLKYVLRGPDEHYHPFMSFKQGETVDLEQIKKYDLKPRYVDALEVSNNDKEVLALNSIIKKLQENNIEVVLFSFPYNRIMLDNTDHNQIENFEKMLKNKQKQFDVNLFFLHDKYSNLNIWKDRLHIANNPKTIIFTEDILEKIIEVINR